MRLDEVKKGGKDQRGRDILDVFWSTQDYVIFQHPSGISPHFSDDEEKAQRQRAAYAKIGPLLSTVNALRSSTVWRAGAIDREIARGVAQSLEGDLQNAERTLTTVRRRLRNLRTIEGRLQYQVSSLCAAVVAGLLFALVRLFAGQEEQGALSALRFAAVGTFGAIGGFLSVSIGIHKLGIDPDTDWKINAVAGASRIVIAIIGSIFVYLAIVSKLVLGNLSLADSEAGLYAISLAAGFSETFVPNILRHLTSETEEGRAQRLPAEVSDPDADR
jgi:hypothetical protein